MDAENSSEAKPFRSESRLCRCRSGRRPTRARELLSPPGDHCGYCDVCGRSGHTQPFPGVLPFEGTWCPRHRRLLARVHPLGRHGVLYWSSAAWLLLALSVYAIV